MTVLDALTYAGNQANLGPVRTDARLRFVHGDIADEALVAELMPGHDAVVNFAAESHVDRSIAGPADFVRTNVLGTQVLLRGGAGRPGCRSSCRCRPTRCTARSTTAPGPRSSPLAPSSPYSASKAAADLIALAYARTFDLPVVDHPLLEQLRPVPVPGEAGAAVRHQPARRRAGAAVRRRAATAATGCTWTTTAAGSTLALTAGRAGRGLQRRRRHRADQPRADRPARGCGRGEPGPGGAVAGPPRARPALLPGHQPDRVASSATGRGSVSTTGWRRWSPGTGRTGPGGSR